MFSYVDLESRIPKDHPIRKIQQIVDLALGEFKPWLDEMYSSDGRPSIPPEMLLRASLLQILFTVHSERQLCERIDYDLIFRWFVGLSMDDRVWNHSTFSKNRDRLMASEIDELLFNAIKKQCIFNGPWSSREINGSDMYSSPNSARGSGNHNPSTLTMGIAPLRHENRFSGSHYQSD